MTHLNLRERLFAMLIEEIEVEIEVLHRQGKGLRNRLERAGKIYLSATVLLREIRAVGYDGGITQLKEFVALIRPQVETAAKT